MSGGPKRNADRVNTIGIVMIWASVVPCSCTSRSPRCRRSTRTTWPTCRRWPTTAARTSAPKDLESRADRHNITNVGKTGKGLTGDQLYQIKIEDGMARRAEDRERRQADRGDGGSVEPGAGRRSADDADDPAALRPAEGAADDDAARPRRRRRPRRTVHGSRSGRGPGSGRWLRGNWARHGLDAEPWRGERRRRPRATTAGTAPQSPTGTTRTNVPAQGQRQEVRQVRRRRADAKKGDKH